MALGLPCQLAGAIQSSSAGPAGGAWMPGARIASRISGSSSSVKEKRPVGVALN